LASRVPDVIFSNQKFQFGYILWDVGILWPFGVIDSYLVYVSYGHLVHFMVIWYFFPVLVCSAKKNLATPIGLKVGRGDVRGIHWRSYHSSLAVRNRGQGPMLETWSRSYNASAAKLLQRHE
jgi:hypothetical protein